MLYIRTGKPGHGKTLNTIKEVDEAAQRAGRIVYYHNVTDLQASKLDAEWYEFEDPEKWFELPHNSIIVIDEAQTWFGTADPRSRPPEHITHFEVMRKSGFEVHLITQDPRYIHVHARRIAHVHVHYWRVMKSQRLLRFENEGVIERVENLSSFKDADKTRVRIDKKFFDVYKSTNADHHFKFEPSRKLIMSVIIIIVAAFLVYRAYNSYARSTSQTEEFTEQPTESVSGGTSLVGSFLSSSMPEGSESESLTVERYLAVREPRVPDLPSSAPVYDQLTAPVSYPRLFCMSTSDPELVARRDPKTVRDGQSCQCYTQQATKFNTTFDFCLAASQNGYFDSALPDRSREQMQAMHQPHQYNYNQPQEHQERVRVDVIPHEKPQSPFMW